jgi:hypothetical protein
MISLRKKATLSKFIISGILLLTIIPIVFLIIGIKTTNNRKEFLKIINTSSDKSVITGNCKLNNSNLIIKELKKVRPYIAHHTGPVNPVILKIENNSVTFILAIDQDRKEELWIYYKGREIGRITSEKVYQDIYYGNCKEDLKEGNISEERRKNRVIFSSS